jgi:NAD(P)-dependent dehydrogenase (short-subunit alcohol dehydrogenase family)
MCVCVCVCVYHSLNTQYLRHQSHSKFLTECILILFFQNGVIRGLHLAFEYMGTYYNKNGGVVVNIASITSLEPLDLIPIYSGIKHAVVGLTKSFGVGRPCFVPSYNFAKRSGIKRVELP